MRNWLAYLQLLRLPTVFTAMADIFLGFLLTHGRFQPELDFGLLLLASSCLYLAGMVFNDVFDRRVDAVERPGRPIPSGRVSTTAAVRLGILLVLAGIGAANIVGWPSLLVAGLLVVCIFAYDGGLKRTPLGPLAMGSCRFLNVMLGASAVASFEALWSAPQVLVAPALGVYIVGVTWFARQEAVASSRLQLALGMFFVNLGLAGLIAFVLTQPGLAETSVVLIVLLVVALTINRRLSLALFDPAPARVQPAIKTMLLSLVMLDATLVLFQTGNSAYALATAALLLPAILLSRTIPMT